MNRKAGLLIKAQARSWEAERRRGGEAELAERVLAILKLLADDHLEARAACRAGVLLGFEHGGVILPQLGAECPAIALIGSLAVDRRLDVVAALAEIRLRVLEHDGPRLVALGLGRGADGEFGNHGVAVHTAARAFGAKFVIGEGFKPEAGDAR